MTQALPIHRKNEVTSAPWDDSGPSQGYQGLSLLQTAGTTTTGVPRVDPTLWRSPGIPSESAPLNSSYFHYHASEEDVEFSGLFIPAMSQNMGIQFDKFDAAKVVFFTIEHEEANEAEILGEFREIINHLNVRPEIFWSVEARIAASVNDHEKAIAQTNGTSFKAKSISEIRDNIIKSKGKDAWCNLLKREEKRKAMEIWRQKRNRV